MINGVGVKIKALRKQMNMTQSELAGTELTKSMLSQIENNVSSPSMKTLQYIAGRLNKPITYFLDDDCSESSNWNMGLNEDYNKLIEQVNGLIENNKLDEAELELKTVEKYGFNRNSKIYADIVFKLGLSLIKHNRLNKGKDNINTAIELYTKGRYYIEAAKAYIELGKVLFQELKYEECVELTTKAFEVYGRDINGDALLEIELNYYKILILSAVGDTKGTLQALKEAIDLSVKSSIYYMTDEFYRLNALFNYLTGNKEEFDKNIKKALKFAEFKEDKMSLSKIYITLALHAIYSKNAEKGKEYAELYAKYAEKKGYIYYIAMARAHYIVKEYELAYENIIKVDFSEDRLHKYDYLTLWSSKTYEGLILSKIGKYVDGIKAIKAGIEKMSAVGNSTFLVDAYKGLSEVYSEMGDFQNAFVSLKKATEIQDILDKSSENIF
ncbi:MAG: helix-turn-helix transcriptional regulator [Bacillota bacterium]|nr:helix-turn-helix transcriptional regulator [Bacillota bacterium]